MVTWNWFSLLDFISNFWDFLSEQKLNNEQSLNPDDVEENQLFTKKKIPLSLSAVYLHSSSLLSQISFMKINLVMTTDIYFQPSRLRTHRKAVHKLYIQSIVQFCKNSSFKRSVLFHWIFFREGRAWSLMWIEPLDMNSEWQQQRQPNHSNTINWFYWTADYYCVE